jgi:beta-lactamase class A
MNMQSQFLASPAAENQNALSNYSLDFTNQSNPDLQAKLEAIDARLREQYAMAATQTAVGILDLKRLRLAMIRPDRIEYAASVPKIGILLAWFEAHPEAATSLDQTNRHELGLMIKASSNEMAAKYSRELGLKRIQQALDHYHFYDTNHGGGIWVGKHYGQGGERIGDPIADHSHAATVRQLLRFYLLLEQERLVSVQASRRMMEIFASPEIPHEENKFVKGLSGRGLNILRKSGSWENWLHDTAVVSGPGRRYILVGLTHHPRGDDYLCELARSVDDLMKE